MPNHNSFVDHFSIVQLICLKLHIAQLNFHRKKNNVILHSKYVCRFMRNLILLHSVLFEQLHMRDKKSYSSISAIISSDGIEFFIVFAAIHDQITINACSYEIIVFHSMLTHCDKNIPINFDSFFAKANHMSNVHIEHDSESIPSYYKGSTKTTTAKTGLFEWPMCVLACRRWP